MLFRKQSASYTRREGSGLRVVGWELRVGGWRLAVGGFRVAGSESGIRTRPSDLANVLLLERASLARPTERFAT
jgi:hypothetical protein